MINIILNVFFQVITVPRIALPPLHAPQDVPILILKARVSMTVNFVLSIISISGRHKQDVISVVELQHNLSKGRQLVNVQDLVEISR